MLRDEAAGHPEILPLLQFTLEELYRCRSEDGLLTLEAYRALGGVAGSLAKRAETVFKDLPDDVQSELPRVLNALVSVGQDGRGAIGRDERRRRDEEKGPRGPFSFSWTAPCSASGAILARRGSAPPAIRPGPARSVPRRTAC